MVGGIEELERIEKTHLQISNLSQSLKDFLNRLREDKISLIFFILAIFSFSYGLWLSSASLSSSTHKASAKPIVVDIGGAVKNPGVYTCKQGDRVVDLIAKAGGLDSRADIYWVDSTLNKARFLVDGEKVYIPFRLPGRKLISDKISLNYATLEELDALPGIGKTTAQKIINNRPYSRPEELLQKGIVSQKVWQIIKKRISL